MTKRNSKLTARAQEMRKNGTKEEKRLWYDFLKGYPIQFRRQMVIQHFIVDFYCPRLKIVIEVDGSQHYEEERMEYDRLRTAVLTGLGCHVIRYSNRDINQNFEAVCSDIHDIVQSILTGTV